MRRRSSSFKLRIEDLEDRIVPAGQPLAELPVISSSNGVLTATLVATTGSVVLDPTGYNGFDAVGGTMLGKVTSYQVQGATRGLFPGPTLHANPGDTIDLTLVNNITADAGSAVGPTNFHTHGLHVSSLGNTDNIFLQIPQGTSNHFIIHIPTTEPEGLYWYHPHVHMLTNPQVWAGMAGLLEIGSPHGGAPELAGLTEHEMSIRSFQTVTDPTTGAVDLADVNAVNVGTDLANNQFAVNGQLNPTIDISAGQTQIWNVANISNGNFLSLEVKNMTTGDTLPLFVVAQDGQPLTVPKPVNTVDLPSGRRSSFMVQIPAGTAPGTQFHLVSVPYFAGFTQWPLGTATDSATLATAVVNSTPGTPFTIPAQLSPPNNLFEDLRSDTVAENRSLEFNQGPVPGGSAFFINNAAFPDTPLIQPRLNTVEEWTLTNLTDDVHPFHIHQNNFQVISVNDVPLDPNGGAITVDVNYPTGAAPQTETYIGGGLSDTVDIPAENPTTHTPGKVVIRMKFTDFLGPYVYHCHILAHEDMGMMGVVNVIPETPMYAIGQNPGFPAKVRLFDGATNAKLAQFFPFSSSDTSGVNVSMGDVNGDGVPDVAVSRVGRPRVRVIDGTKLNQVDANGVILPTALLGDFFGFNSTRAGGINVAVGDMNGDGLGDIVVSGNQGNTKVRIIDATKLGEVDSNKQILPSALISKFDAFPSTFVGGATVATGDVNGDGRIDLIAGSGAGQRDQVNVINGDMLDAVDPSGQISSSALLSTLLPFDDTFNLGVNVAAGNTKGFAFADVIASAATGQTPKVSVYADDEHATAMPGVGKFHQIDDLTPYRPTDLVGLVPAAFNSSVNDILLLTPASGNANAPLTFDLLQTPPTPGAMTM